MQATVSVPARQRAVRLDAAGRLEGAAAFAACLAASVVANARLLRPDVVSDDALVHQFWMRHWQDPALFNDPLTTQLRESVRYPDGYQALFWLAAHGFDPIAFGEWLGVGLMALSGWLVFRIVREQESWRPAAWIGAALFLSLLGIHRFAGGFPRAFVQPVVLLTVLLAMRGRNSAAAVVAGAGALFYPPAGVLAVGVLALSAVRGWRIDVRRAASGGVAAAILLAAVLVPRLLAGGAPRVMSAAEARAFPEFGPHGTLPFFVDSLTRYLSQNRSGFDLRWAGSVLVVAGLVLLVARWRDVRGWRPRCWRCRSRHWAPSRWRSSCCSSSTSPIATRIRSWRSSRSRWPFCCDRCGRRPGAAASRCSPARPRSPRSPCSPSRWRRRRPATP